MSTLIELLLWFVALYPPVTAAVWVAGALLFRVLDERNDAPPPTSGRPGVTLLIPAYNEELVIGTCVRAALEVDYPVLEILVLDDGSTDGTADAAAAAAASSTRVEIVRDTTNRGKAARLNLGFRRARHGLVAVVDADTHLHPRALGLLVSRLERSPRVAAVAGAPHVTNRTNLLTAMQVLEAASIIGLVRRTQALGGRVGTVAGVLGLFRRDAVLAVGGYDGRMATEDIDLSWRLLLAGWHTAYEPNALIGMQVPTTISALWRQRRRWARGQGEVIRTYFREVARPRHRFLWPLALEAVVSLVWVFLLVLAFVASAIATALPDAASIAGIGIAWGVAVCVVATLQLTFALAVDARHDNRAFFAFLLAPVYTAAFWLVGAAAALRAEAPAIVTGPKDEHVVWDVPREQVGTAPR